MLGQGGYGMMDKVNRITSPGITPGIKNLLNDMVLTYYQVCDIIYERKEELVCLRK
jgi:hypothetical protein